MRAIGTISVDRSVADASDAARKALSRMLRRGSCQRRSATQDRHASTPKTDLCGPLRLIVWPCPPHLYARPTCPAPRFPPASLGKAIPVIAIFSTFPIVRPIYVLVAPDGIANRYCPSAKWGPVHVWLADIFCHLRQQRSEFEIDWLAEPGNWLVQKTLKEPIR